MCVTGDWLTKPPPEQNAVHPIGSPGECLICKGAYVRRLAKQVTCGRAPCRYALTYWRHKYDTRKILRQRERFRTWAVENRNVKRRNVWLEGAPPYGPYLPGGAVEISVSPTPEWPVVHRNIRALHGMITQFTGPHDPQIAQFSLIPWKRGIGWGAYIREDATVKTLAGTRHQGVLFDRPVSVKFGNLYRFRTPQVTKRGHQLLRIDAITPICVRAATNPDGHERVYTVPTAGNLLSTLCTWTPKRIALDIPNDCARLLLKERHTFPARVPIGGKLGEVSGWVGYVIVEVNATTRWLLEVAQQIGFGSKTAYGFGRIKVTEVD